MTSLAAGILWPLLDAEGSLCMLFVSRLASVEEWPQFAKDKRAWRMRRLGE